MYKKLYHLIKAKAEKSLPTDEMKFISIYRYFSLILTSIIYLTGGYRASIANKLAVIICLTIAVVLLNYIYLKCENEINIVKALIIIESIGNVVILIPTGGLNSPYVWYSLNTVLVTAYYLSLKYSLLNITIYAALAAIISSAFYSLSDYSLINYLQKNSNLILSYLLIVIIIQSLMKLANKLREESRRLDIANGELIEANKINQQLLIVEEQNRIANEIHDSVSQRLFFISSKLHSLVEGIDNKNSYNVKDELKQASESLKIAMKELRETIYSYSDKKNGVCRFEEKIRNYINEIKILNEVSINLDLSSSIELASNELKKVLYRIISETLGNAINHGKSKNINIILAVKNENIIFEIKDDGSGFDIKNNTNMGLGINNIYNLVHSYGGETIIKSQMSKGTSINIELPLENTINRKQERAI